MNKEAANPLQNRSTGGLTAVHPITKVLTAIPLAPASTDELNTLRTPLTPTGCFCLYDQRFAFDSSFVRPEAEREFGFLQALREHLAVAGKKPLLSLFGHADTAGTDDYNKTLSGRRAEAVYAALIRDVAMWERLYDHPFHGDNWGLRSIQMMLDALLFDPKRADGVMDEPTRVAIKGFQQSKGLKSDGDPGPKTRAALFAAYMEVLCTDHANKPFRLTKDEFLGRGVDAKGKGDYQGCADFNPTLVFSLAEDARFKLAKDKTERNSENAPNRRVLVFLFAPDSVIDVAKWPCPRTAEGAAACHKRFWSDEPLRRRPQLLRREYEKDKNTFGCRFYDRLANDSPCERTHNTLLTFDLFFQKKQTNSDAKELYRLVAEDESFDQTLNRTGAVREPNGTVRLRFTEVPSIPTYTLFQILGPGIEIPLLTEFRVDA